MKDKGDTYIVTVLIGNELYYMPCVCTGNDHYGLSGRKSDHRQFISQVPSQIAYAKEMDRIKGAENCYTYHDSSKEYYKRARILLYERMMNKVRPTKKDSLSKYIPNML